MTLREFADERLERLVRTCMAEAWWEGVESVCGCSFCREHKKNPYEVVE